MYKAILKRKNGQKIIYNTPFIHSHINYIENDKNIKINLETMIDLTPDNIINEGRFTQVKELKEKKLTFELVKHILNYSVTL